MSGRRRSLLAATALLATLGLAAAGAMPAHPARGESPAGIFSPKGFAVLELFTSEGCSSCPPADALLSALQREHADDPVYPLSFHVDYWNDLGWRDPFSAQAYSERQRHYARALGSRRVYTPQLVINGREHLVGSRASAVRAAVDAALDGEPSATLELSLRVDGTQLHTRHAARGAPPGSGVTLVLTRRDASARVTRGENRGRTLRHVRVVQELRSTGLVATTTWHVPRGADPDELEVTALLQDRTTMAIHAAARAQPRR